MDPMDPMDYIMHNPRSSGHYDPVHSASNHWMSHSHNSPSYPWQTQNPSLPQSYPHHPLQPAPGPGPDPFQLGHHHGGILPPMLGLPHPHAFSENMPGAISPRPSGRHQTYHRSTMPPPVAPVASGTGAHSRDGAFANQIPGRPLSFQPPAGLGIPPPGAGAGAAPEPNSQQQQQQRPPFLASEPPTNNFGQHNNNSPHFVPVPVPVPVPLPPHPYMSSPPPRRGHFSSASTSSRTVFRDIPSPTRPSPPSSGFRRSHHTRQRRPTSTRIMSSEPGREDDDDAARHVYFEHGMYSPGGSDSSAEANEETVLRHMQLMRGAVSTKMVASKSTLRSLESVKIEDIPEGDRSCVICYGDYGVESPEGVCEAPLRLPKCGHIFGDHCIKTWLDQSDSCPYCRDKLHSEPKQHTSASTRAFMSLMRSQGLHVSSRATANPDDILARAMVMSYGMGGRNGSPSRQPVTAGRRSPPSDAGERQRRTRARHDNGHTRELRPLSGGHSRAVHFDTPSQRAAPGAPLIGHSFVHHWDEMSPMERRQQWTNERDQISNGRLNGPPNSTSTTTTDAPGEASAPTSTISMSALSPLAPMYQPQGVFINATDRHPLGTAPSHDLPLLEIRNPPPQARAGPASGGNENATPSLATPQDLPGTTQGNSNRSW
ncbi:hypothetical protein B0J15DRAFT_567835 [Fusarium solani]|uniref:RING-type domain-containing protein n=1 Tax=Fusarium solani TaxID=169388 RepID=A0A9P9L4Y4_FUSSL|nr:uncharacterized protein B0J15DRAFT_567835 [Fusarium solani]KAH7274307.1 hypothetical protein B0J15DRAFT_567835 [Fusarium solani]